MDDSQVGEWFLRVGAVLSFVAAAMHVGIILGGASWYRFFGAGEQFAKAAEAGKLYPHIVTLGIASMLTLWGVYALSGAGDIPDLPLVKVALLLISAIYLLRGVVFVPLFWRAGSYSKPFMLWSSLICLTFGIVHAAGLTLRWSVI